MLVKEKYATLVHVDGGICSQMYQYVVGYAMANQNRNVMYDLSWFKKYGKDMNGEYIYNFDLLKLFPNLDIHIADDKMCREYNIVSSFFPKSDSEKITMCSNRIPSEPVLMQSYYWIDEKTYKIYPSLFKIDLNNIVDFSVENQKMANKIMKDDNSVGVHVRRGDMASTTGFWIQLGPDYFINAIKLFDIETTHFYFFSQDLDWVEKNIVSKIDGLKSTLVDINDSEHGYCDLALLSLCKNQIASQGSFGGVASILNSNKDKILVLPKVEGGFKYHPKACKWEDVTEAMVWYAEI
ncbi:hypothetical protein BXO88_01345 [Oribacterium sp. C9]|nr:hypothetical protein BXO88_01345 [Oribacterium sp. C9]